MPSDTTGRAQGPAIIHSNRFEDLRDLLLKWMQMHPLAPLDEEVILVQSSGMAQWLKMSMAQSEAAGGLGVAASLLFELPSSFVWRAYRAVLGAEALSESSPYDRDALSWRLYRLLDAKRSDPKLASLAAYFESDTGGTKRWQLACELAGLFDQYQVYRADWLNRWSAGADDLPGCPENTRAALDAFDWHWQPHLWRLLREDMGPAHAQQSRADVHQSFLKACSGISHRHAGLPKRVVVFGLSAIPRQVLEALSALSPVMDVLIFVHNPCQFYWADLIDGKEAFRAQSMRQARKNEQFAFLSPEELYAQGHPLLAAWGRQGRDFLRLLDEYDDTASYLGRLPGQKIDLFPELSLPSAGGCLLEQLQSGILRLESKPGEGQESLLTQDRSVEFAICHSRQREIEVLQDALISALNNDPHLKPRDIMVMMPNVDEYVPHIQAVFGRLDPVDPRFIPYSLSDQSASVDSPLSLTLEAVLKLPSSRMGLSEVLFMLEVPAIQAMFGISAEGARIIARWAENAGVRWGLNEQHKAALPGLDALGMQPWNTWKSGIHRMLAGYVAGGSEQLGDIVPYDEVAGLEAAHLGGLADLIDRLAEVVEVISQPAQVGVWRARILGILDQLFRPTDAREVLLLEQFKTQLDDWSDLCFDAGFQDELISLEVVRPYLLGQIEASNLQRRFMGGSVTFSTLMPMRAVPFRHIYLLGMNDGAFPRQQLPPDFDLMAVPGLSQPGDRSRREDDRYLFLEALLSARDKLTVSWVGRNIRDNSVRQPSVLVAQLLDYLNAHWRVGELAAGQALTTEYPLQPFSEKYFKKQGGLVTYAYEWRQMSDSPKGQGPETGRELGACLDGDSGLYRGVESSVRDANLTTVSAYAEDRDLHVAELQSLLKDPVKFYMRHSLNLTFEAINSELEDCEPFEPNRLQEHQIFSELMDQCFWINDDLAFSQSLKSALNSLLASGCLPPGGLGLAMRQSLEDSLCSLRRTFLLHSPCGPEEFTFKAWKHHHSNPAQGTNSEILCTHEARFWGGAGQHLPLQLIVYPGNCLKEQKLELTKVVNVWPAHVFANLMNPCQTWVLARDGIACFEAHGQTERHWEAQATFNRLLMVLEQALAQCPAASRKLGLTLLQEVGAPCLQMPICHVSELRLALQDGLESKRSKLVNSLEGGVQQIGERQYSPELSAAWPSLDAMILGGLVDWSVDLYGDFMAFACPVPAKNKVSGAVAPGLRLLGGEE